jgi:RimJ/RimL family protein N-acetyltransferase
LELRLATRTELRELAEVARRGIHRRREMPFAVAWTDNSDSPRFVDDFVEFHEDALAHWRKSDWTLHLIAFHEGRPIGTQGLGAKSFARKRTIGTGSWLGRRWQRHGLGTEMRAAVLELAFRGLGAESATSGAIEGNAASLGVSRKLGYVSVGTTTVAPRGRPLVEHELKRARGGWRSPVPVEIRGLDEVRSLFGA